MFRAALAAIGRFFLWLSGRGANEARAAGQGDTVAPGGPAQRPSDWQVMIGSRNTIAERVSLRIQERLGQRVPRGRDPANDDALFSPLADATVVAIGQNEYQLAISMFYDCFQLALAYEDNHQVEIHKGAMTFNAGVAFLRSHDFPAAMHYFELSQHETRQSYGQGNWGVFESDLFDRNYWAVIDLFEQETPLDYYSDFWGVPYGRAAAIADWQALSNNSKLLYVMIGAERIRYTRLKSLTNWQGADGVGLFYWNLVADLARLIETEIRGAGFHGGGLRDMILNYINNSPVPDFKRIVTGLHNTRRVSSPGDFNNVFPHLRQVIEDATQPANRRIAYSAYLAGVARNQVQHQVEAGMIIYVDRAAAVTTVNALLTLCRFRDWVA